MTTLETADKLIQKGDDEKKSISLFSNKYENALKCYKEASKIYQLHKQWDKCAKALIKCLECKNKLEYDFDSPAQYYMDIAHCYKNIVHCDGYIEYLEKANEIFKMDGNFDKVIKNYMSIALLYEEQYHFHQAVKYYQNVLEVEEIKMTKSLSNYYNTKLKIAELYIKMGKDYQLAINHYDDVMSYYLNKDDFYSTYKIPDLFLTIMLCYICLDDEVMAKRKLGEYANKHHKLYNSSEIRIIESIIENSYDESLAIKYNKLNPLQYKLISVIIANNKKKDEVDFC